MRVLGRYLLIVRFTLYLKLRFSACLFKAVIGRLFLALLGKNSIIIFQHYVIQVVREKTRLLPPLGSIFRLYKIQPLTKDFG